MTTISDEYLVVTAKNGGHWAYVELCERYRNLVFHIVHRITRNSHDTEDVVQDAWMKAFVHLGTFDGRSTFSTWLTRIAINSALMMLRKRRWHLEDSLDDHGDTELRSLLEIAEPSHNPEEYVICIERQLQLRQAQEGPIKDIAATAGLSVAATKSRLTRARLKLRQPSPGVRQSSSAIL